MKCEGANGGRVYKKKYAVYGLDALLEKQSKDDFENPNAKYIFRIGRPIAKKIDKIIAKVEQD